MALGSGEVVVKVSGVVAITNDKVVDAVCCWMLESETEIVTVYVPEKVVVPLIKPLEEFPVIPRGNPPMVQVNGSVPPDVSGWKL